MKRLFLYLLICLFLYQPTEAQEQITYLPLVIKNGCNMAKIAKFEISDGETTVNLLSSGKTGFHLKDWNPAIVQLKEGGIFQDSPIAPGRRLVYGVDATAIEDLTVDVNDYDENGLIEQAQDLMRLLLKARAYQSTDFQTDPVWVRARSDCETNDRYALIINWSIPALSNPYGPPFVSADEIALMDDLTLQLERGHWLANQPGVGTCAQVGNQQTWYYSSVWAVNTVLPADFVRAMIQTTNGDIYAADESQILRSQDNGATWAVNTLLPTATVYSLLQLANGDIYAGDTGQILRSQDNGATWFVLTTDPVAGVYSLLQLANGDIYAGEEFQIWRSQDNGASWATVTTDPSGQVNAMIQLSNGYILAGDRGQIWRSTNNGVTWALVSTAQVDEVFSLLQLANGDILAGDNGNIWRSNDNGNTWFLATNQPNSFVFDIIQTANGDIYASQDGQIWISIDNGISWSVTTTSPVNEVYSLLQTANGSIYAGEEGQIWRYQIPTTIMGAGSDCDNEVYVSNKHHIANLTHIYIDDGGVYTSLFPMSVFPVTLLPAVPAVNDALYFGIDTTLDNTGPFSSLVFDIASPITYTTSYTITWEYWSGAAWSALTVRDGTNPGSGVFRLAGVNSVHWAPPSNWAANDPGMGITGYWVRARLSALVGTITPPTQQTRNIYTAVQAYTEIVSAQVSGDIPAIAQIKTHNRSDLDGPGGSAPNLYDNRVLVGLRSNDRGDTFVAYINISDEQNPIGVTLSLGTNTTFGDDITAPTGRRATYNPAGVEAMATRATIALSSTIARDFYGTYHAFLRAQRTAGVSTDLTVRLQVATGSGGITYTTTSQQLQATTAFEVLDFGEITLPVSSSFKSTDLADTTEIRIQASAASGTPDLRLYDLILIPVNEWSADVVDFANESDSDVGRSNGIAKLLDIDSVTDPRIDVKGLVRTADASEFITSEYNVICGGPAILQANADQRLWFFAMQTSATGASYSWIAPPEIAHTIQLYHNSRYLGMRGSR